MSSGPLPLYTPKEDHHRTRISKKLAVLCGFKNKSVLCHKIYSAEWNEMQLAVLEMVIFTKKCNNLNGSNGIWYLRSDIWSGVIVPATSFVE